MNAATAITGYRLELRPGAGYVWTAAP